MTPAQISTLCCAAEATECIKVDRRLCPPSLSSCLEELWLVRECPALSWAWIRRSDVPGELWG